MSIITSLLDTDFYKWTLAQVIWASHSYGRHVEYRLIDRKDKLRLSMDQYDRLVEEIGQLSTLRFQEDELEYLSSLKQGEILIFEPEFIEFLRNFSLDHSCVTIGTTDGKLDLRINGKWLDTVLFETLIMSIVSEIYHEATPQENLAGLVLDQGARFNGMEDLQVYDFGTRRRFSKDFHYRVAEYLYRGGKIKGTSNVFLAKQWNTQPVGTQPHEFTMAHYYFAKQANANQFVEERANELAIQAWNSYYNGILGVALPDTYGTDKFLFVFGSIPARIYDGVRQDSGSPTEFYEKVTHHYEKLGIDPSTKTVIFSDSLTPEKIREISLYDMFRSDRMSWPRKVFAVGTNLSNCVPGVEPLGIVIKLTEFAGMPLHKTSDNPSKTLDFRS